MSVPTKSLTLTAEQVAALNQKLSDLRHDVNNQLSLMVGATELIRFKPESTPRMLTTLNAVPQKITEQIRQFSDEFEQIFGITK